MGYGPCGCKESGHTLLVTKQLHSLQLGSLHEALGNCCGAHSASLSSALPLTSWNLMPHDRWAPVMFRFLINQCTRPAHTWTCSWMMRAGADSLSPLRLLLCLPGWGGFPAGPRYHGDVLGVAPAQLPRCAPRAPRCHCRPCPRASHRRCSSTLSSGCWPCPPSPQPAGGRSGGSHGGQERGWGDKGLSS